MPANERINLHVEGAVATIVLCRAPVNAIDDALLAALEGVFDQIEANAALTLLRIRSDQKVFCAGADLRMVAKRVGKPEGAAEMVETVRHFHRVFDRLATLPVVTLAEIEGHALGGGLELALACDLRLASHKARLGLPEAKVGLLPGAGGTQRLTVLCGAGVAARIILSAETLDGREAENVGLAQWAADPADFANVAEAIAGRIKALSPPAIRAAKQCLCLAAPLQADGVAAEIRGIGQLMLHPETELRVRSFLQV